MARRREEVVGRWLDRIEIESIGIGAFYYIASTAVIGIMNYAGNGRTEGELALFFGLLAGTLIAATVAASLSPMLRDAMIERQGAPAVVVVLLAMTSACFSMFEPMRNLFFLCPILTGLSCAMLVTSWERSLSRSPLRKSLFEIPASLVVAVLCYFIYRTLSFASTMAADSWHVTVGVVGMLALLLAYSPEYSDADQGESRSRPFLILGSVAAVFAMGGGLFAFLSRFPGSAARAPFTPYFLVEIIGALAIVGWCALGSRYLRWGHCRARGAASLLFSLVSLVLLFGLGAFSGFMLVENCGNGLLWEASVWVLAVAALAFGMRTSLYLVDGMVIGVLFEAWCVGQMLAMAAALVSLAPFPLSVTLVAVAGLAYLLATAKLVGRVPGTPIMPLPEEVREEGMPATRDADEGEANGENITPIPEQDVCRQIGEEYGLTAREVEVLCLIAEGRSARFIADELIISYNTARSHMRNVYEKLGIHAKQEVITLVRSWE